MQEWEEERRVEAEDLGAGDDLPLFLPTPPFMASVGGEWGMSALSFVLTLLSSRPFCFGHDFPCSFHCDFLGAHLLSLGKALTEGKVATDRHRVVREQEKRTKMCAAIV